MAISDTFLGTCRTAINLLPELSTFRTALTTIASPTRSARSAAWAAAYDDAQSGLSPAYRLSRAIRETVQAQADILGTMGPADRESAFRTLNAEYVPAYDRPPTILEEQAELERLRLAELTS